MVTKMTGIMLVLILNKSLVPMSIGEVPVLAAQRRR
jgi:hypothetical protein